ncbi:hypothetical protein [Nocardioides bigeumensis]|uniref:Tat pathway signal sequence domain protein n=1 Tax=Nocardioides bigeumensis TaxID=433657 RepID=A0ABP5K0H6_9ACTN
MTHQMLHAATSVGARPGRANATRRSVVRAAAWAAPAVIVAATAPPAAASVVTTECQLSLALGATYVAANADSWSLYFSGASVLNIDGPVIPATKLQLSIFFLPNGGGPAPSLTTRTTASQPTFLLANPGVVPFPRYQCNLAVTADQPVGLTDGVWLTTPATGRPPGRFELVLSVLDASVRWKSIGWRVATP